MLFPVNLLASTEKKGRIVRKKQNQIQLEETALEQGWTDHISLTHDLDLQPSASCGHDLRTR